MVPCGLQDLEIEAVAAAVEAGIAAEGFAAFAASGGGGYLPPGMALTDARHKSKARFEGEVQVRAGGGTCRAWVKTV